MHPDSPPDRTDSAPQSGDAESVLSLEMPPPQTRRHPAAEEWPRYKRELDALLASLGP